jgi:hypothetical protein
MAAAHAATAGIPLSTRRAVEAEMLCRVYAAATPRLGREAALELIGAAVDDAAREAGKGFAAKAPGGKPCLTHFADVLGLWTAGGALSISCVENDGNCLSFRVDRCGYMAMYKDLGIPEELHPVLSCRRDAAFAEGYSRHLRFSRPQAISDGSECCRFRFTWEA